MSLQTLGDITRMAATLPAELQQAQKRGVNLAALHVTRSIRNEIRAATGGDMRLSGVGRRGAKVGARYDVKGTTNPTALIKAIGPLHLIEHDTSPHTIGPRGRRVSKRWQNAAAKGKVSGKPIYLSGAKSLKLGDGRFVAYANHPGTRAKRPFEKGYLKSRNDTGAIFDKEVQAAIRRVLI